MRRQRRPPRTNVDELHQLANDAVAGHMLPAFKVDVLDQYGNLVSNDASSVTVSVNSGPAGGSITSGTPAQAASGGVAAFGDLVIQKAGSYTLMATSSGLTTAFSNSFAINPRLAFQLAAVASEVRSPMTVAGPRRFHTGLPFYALAGA